MDGSLRATEDLILVPPCFVGRVVNLLRSSIVEGNSYAVISSGCTRLVIDGVPLVVVRHVK